MKLFILFFAIAVSFKYFALMVFLPLVLLKHKRIITIILYLIGSFSVLLLSRISFMFYSEAEAVSHSGVVNSMIFGNDLPIGLTGFQVYIAGFLTLCIFCYIKTIKTPQEWIRYSIYIPFLSFSLFFLFSPAHPFWFVMLTPFLPIIIFQNYKRIKINLLLDTLAASSMIILQQMYYWWCYDLRAIERMLFPIIFTPIENMNEPLNANKVLRIILQDWEGGKQITFNTIFIVCLITILIINFPKFNVVSDETIIQPVINRSVIWFRLFTSGGICLIPVLIYLSSILVFGTIK